MVPVLQCSQTFSFSERKQLLVNGIHYTLQSANPSIFRSAQGLMLNTRWINTAYTETGVLENTAKPFISANSLVRLDNDLMPCSKQVPYAELWNTHIGQWAIGLQDVRFFYHEDTVFFLAAKPVGKKVEQVFGSCRQSNTQYLSEHQIISPTFPNPVGPVEKNWVFFPQGPNLSIIHSWYPLSICSINEDTHQLIKTQTIATPAVFKSFRGSTSSFRLGDNHAFVVHTVSKTMTSERQQLLTYRHRIVMLANSGHPIRYSEPFKFGHKNIEYCLGAIRKGNNILLSGSIQDATCCIWIIEEDELQNQLQWFDL